MRGNELLDKMDLIDRKYIEEADRMPAKRTKTVTRWIAAAACLCIIASGTVLLGTRKKPAGHQSVLTPITVNATEIDGMGYSLTKAGRHISTANVMYNGWRSFVSNEDYILNNGYFTSGVGKYDLFSDTVSEVCLDSECTDQGCISVYDDEHCPIPNGSKLFFIAGNRVYYKYRIFSYDEEELEKEGGAVCSSTDIIAWYDFGTGESRDILSIAKNDFEQIYNVIHDGEFLYYDRYLPNKPAPETPDDYTLYFCRMSMESEREEIMFAFPEKCNRDYYGFPDPLAVADGKAYFTLNNSGRLLRVNTDGSEPTYLIDGEDGFRGLYDEFGTFFCDGKIYYLQCEYDGETELIPRDKNCLYRIDCITGEREKLTDDYVYWLFVSDDSIFYELSLTQPDGAKEVPADPWKHIIKELDHDGAEKATYKFRAENIAISGLWGGGDYLFFSVGYHQYEKEAEEEIHYPAATFNLETGEYKEIIGE